MCASPRSPRDDSADHAVKTAGQIFPDGRSIELVLDPSSNTAKLLDYKAGRAIVGDRVKVGSRTYGPLPLTSATLRAVCFPSRTKNYGSVVKLFDKLTAVITTNFAPLERDTRLIAHWQLATWFSDMLPTLPSLLVSCPSAAWVTAVFRLLRCGCRHGVRLADLSASAVRALPKGLQPTLLLDQQGFTRSTRELIRASSNSGVFVTHAGDFLDLRCAIALSETGNAIDSSLTSSVVRVALAPEDSYPMLTERDAEKIASDLQPLLLNYRLRNFTAVRESTFDVPEFTPELRNVARSLGAAVIGDPELARGVVSLLAPQDADARASRGLLPEVAVITVALALVHEARIKNIFTADFAKLVNAALRANGEIREYSAEEMGWQLSRVGLFTRKIGGRRGLRFDRDLSRLTHDLAHRWGVTISSGFSRCPDCKPNASA